MAPAVRATESALPPTRGIRAGARGGLLVLGERLLPLLETTAVRRGIRRRGVRVDRCRGARCDGWRGGNRCRSRGGRNYGSRACSRSRDRVIVVTRQPARKALVFVVIRRGNGRRQRRHRAPISFRWQQRLQRRRHLWHFPTSGLPGLATEPSRYRRCFGRIHSRRRFQPRTELRLTDHS